MVKRGNNHSIPETCKNYACLRILEIPVRDRMSKEGNPEYTKGLEENLKELQTYLKLFNRQGVIVTFPQAIRRHLKEVDIYFETGCWERIYE